MITRLAQLAIVLLVLTIGASSMTSWAASNAVPASSAVLDSHVPVPNDFKPPECAAIAIAALVTGTGTFSGTAANDLILGSAADDTITGNAGDDCILAGNGNDGIRGGGGANTGGGADVLNGGAGTDTCAPEGGAPTLISCDQVVAVHLHARITAQQSQTGAVLTTKQTVSAANLADVGFADNDDVLVLWFYKVGPIAANEVHVDLKYNGASTMSGVTTRYDLNGAGRERASVFMARVNLGALADFEVQLASNNGNASYLEKSELLVVRLADFGTENVDWFWNKSTTVAQNTNAYSAVNRAAITWTPLAVEDWVYFAYVHATIDNTTVNMEARVTLDGALHSGDWSFEGENAVEEIPIAWWQHLSALSAAPHTLAMQTRDDAAVAAPNDHRESAIFVFRADRWANVFRNQPGTVTVGNGADVQVATVTNAISAAQPLVIWGQGSMDLNTVDTQAHLWVRQDGVTVVDPQGDTASGLAAGYAFDASDEVPIAVLGYGPGVAGAQDFDLFASHSAAGNRNLLSTGLLVWGMAVWAP